MYIYTCRFESNHCTQVSTMKFTGLLTLVLGSFAATSHGYVLDKSCDPYRDMVITGMKSAFDLAQAGSDLLSHLTPSGSGATWQAQKDLVKFMFAEALTNGNPDPNNANWNTVSSKFNLVLAYNSNGGQGQPDITPTNSNADQTGVYTPLGADKLVLFCDYSRFTKNQNCDKIAKPGITCDRTNGMAWPMDDIYNDCKSRSIFSSSSIQVGT